MNKRQKKKQITLALKRYEKGKATEKDKRVLKNQGRQAFIEKYELPPEIADVDFNELEKAMRQAINRIKQKMADAFEVISKAMKNVSLNLKDNDKESDVN